MVRAKDPALASASPSISTREKLRAGRRGPGSKPARDVSPEEFAKDYDRVASDRAADAAARRQRKADKRRDQRDADMAAGITFEQRCQIDEAAFSAALSAVLARSATEEQKRLVRNRDALETFASRYKSSEESQRRIFQGYKWPGGYVAGAYQKPFVERLLRSWAHPFYKRFAASAASVKSGRLMAGPGKDKGCRWWSKLDALDQTHCFFNSNCEEFIRADVDKFDDGREATFRSEAELRAWIDYKVKEHDLPCGPMVVSWVWDDNRPGLIIRPHLWWILPERKGVWNDRRQHRMFGQVAAALTKAFGGDAGGLALLGHGKNPLSPHNGTIIYQDSFMPTLAEYAEALDLTWDPTMMARKLSVARLDAAGFDAADSNTHFSLVAKACNAARIDVHASGFDTSDVWALEKRIHDLVMPVAVTEIGPRNSKEREAVADLVRGCATWAAATFDSKKLDATKDRGAAAHLMSPGDSATTKMSKGQTHSAAVRVRKTRNLIVAAISLEIACGREPTIASVTAKVNRTYNTVKAHFFKCYVEVIAAKAVLAIRGAVKGVPVCSLPSSPGRTIILTALKQSDVPSNWLPTTPDPVLTDHFAREKLRLAQRQRRQPGFMSSPASRHVEGLELVNFMAAGPITIYRPKAKMLDAA